MTSFQIIKTIAPYLDITTLFVCSCANKQFHHFLQQFIHRHFQTKLQWINTEKQLLKNTQMSKWKVEFDDYFFIPDLGLMMKIKFVKDHSEFELHFVTWRGICKMMKIGTPKTFKNFGELWYSMELYWDQRDKIIMIASNSHYFTIDVGNLEKIGFKFIKRNKNNKLFSAQFSNWFSGKTFIKYRNGKRLVQWKRGKFMTLNYRSNKRVHVSTTVRPAQLFTFGPDDSYTFVRGCHNVEIVNNLNPSEISKIRLEDLDDISAFFFDDTKSILHLFMMKEHRQLKKIDDKWVEGERLGKVNWNFGSWCPLEKKFLVFEPSIQNPNSALDMDEWIQTTEPHHLRIQDILNLKPGEQLEVIHLDRNIHDTCEHYNKREIIKPPLEFFEGSVAVYTHESDLKGQIYFPEIREYMDFEFHVEYDSGCWYPFENGQLPLTDPQSFSNFGDKSGWTWQMFPQNTRIGWRGPMIIKSKLSSLPHVYWVPNEPFLLH